MVFAMVAMVALASCSKTELVDNSAPTPISFKAVTGSVTKAPETQISGDLGVSAFVLKPLTSTTDKEKVLYFENAKFTKADNITWTGGKFWPIESTLDFVVYYPYQANGVSATYTNATSPNAVDEVSLEVTIPNNATVQTDYMYSDTFITDKNKNSTDMSVKLNHALSLITVKFVTSQGIVVNAAQLDNTYQSGKYNVSYEEGNWNTPVIKWSNWGDLSVLTLDLTNPVLVVPTSDAEDTDNLATPSITFDYTMPGCAKLTYTQTLSNMSNWKPGTHYTYTITITPSEIKFTPSVNDWVTDVNFNGSIGIQG